MKKLTTSVALASALLASTALAENSGAFLGVNVGYGAAKPSGDGHYSKSNYTGFRYGILGGYKEVLSDRMGMRYYATLDYGTKYSNGSGNPDITSLNIYANGDVLFNFAQDDTMEYGAFVGIALGYIQHNISSYTYNNASYGTTKPKGFDLGINLGLRAQSAANHGVEIYSRFGLLDQEVTASGTYEVSQPYQVGVRYIYSF